MNRAALGVVLLALFCLAAPETAAAASARAGGPGGEAGGEPGGEAGGGPSGEASRKPSADPPIRFQLEGLAAPLADALREAQALAEAQAAAAADGPGRAQAWGRLGMFFQAQHLPWAAEQAYSRALTAADAPRWRYLRAIVREERGRLAEAIADYLRVTETAPDNTAAWYRLGAGRLLAGDGPGAEHALDEALRRNPKLAIALVAKADVEMARRDWRAARRLLERAWALAPNAGLIAYKLALAHRAAGDAESARRWLDRRGGANAKPQLDDPLLLEVAQLSLSARFFVKAGEWALERGELREALAALENAVALAPDAADIRLTHARLLEMAERPAEALRQVRHVIAAHPDNSKAWYRLAWLLRRGTAPAETAEAAAAVRRSLTLEESLPARTLAAAFAMRDGRHAVAARHYAVARQAAPDNAYVHYWHGMALLAAGDCGGRAGLRAALERRGSWGEAHLALARADALCGSAANALRRATGLLRAKDDPDTRLTLAFAELGAGERDAAARRAATDATHPDAALLRDALASGGLPQRPFAAASRWWLPSELRATRRADGP